MLVVVVVVVIEMMAMAMAMAWSTALAAVWNRNGDGVLALLCLQLSLRAITLDLLGEVLLMEVCRVLHTLYTSTEIGSHLFLFWWLFRVLFLFFVSLPPQREFGLLDPFLFLCDLARNSFSTFTFCLFGNTVLFCQRTD